MTIAEQFKHAYIFAKAHEERTCDDRQLDGVMQAIQDAAISSGVSGYLDYVIYTFKDGSTFNDETLETTAAVRP